MTENYQQKYSNAINQIIKSIKSDDEKLRDFTFKFYSSMSLADLQEVPFDLAGEIANLVYQNFKHFAGGADILTSNPTFLQEHYGRERLAITIINNDKPFLVDSLSIALKEMGFKIYRIIHPQLFTKRSEAGDLLELLDSNDSTKAESLIYFETSILPSDMTEADLRDRLENILRYVGASVSDWRVMLAKLRELNTHIELNSKLPNHELQEAGDFINWLLANHFIFLSYAEYDFYDEKGAETLRLNPKSPLGIMKVAGEELAQEADKLPPELRYFAEQATPIQVAKFNVRSKVHRDVYMDSISVKRYDDSGRTIGESRFLGLFTSPVYYQQTATIPYIRTKVAKVLNAAGFDASGHSGKALRAALEFFPRDEMFQISEGELMNIALGIVSLEERPDIRIFLRHDTFERFVSCFVYMPRDKFNTYVRQEIAEVLQKIIGGKLDVFFAQVTDSPLARIIYVIRTGGQQIPVIDMELLNEKLRFIINYWVDSLREALQDERGANDGERVFQLFARAFPRNYVNSVPIKQALLDIIDIEAMIADGNPRFRLFQTEDGWQLKMFSTDVAATLSDIIPIIENIGFKVRDVVPNHLQLSDNTQVLIREFSLVIEHDELLQNPKIIHVIEDMLGKVWLGDAENDRLNALSALAGLELRQIMLLRAYAHYGRQAEIGYALHYIAETLCKHPKAAHLLTSLFTVRFAPETPNKRDERVKLAHEAVLDELSAVKNIAEDKIIRFIADAMLATLRTNYFQVDEDGAHKPYISFKFDSSKISTLPKPVPFREIFVYSRTTEGIHLRGGKVARGGLRWSDRHQDFRTEVLSLMKAQVVKNTVIVPTGSKGGFISKAKIDESDRGAKLQAGIASYQQFLSGLLDLTDNRIGAEIIPPERVVRYDDDDPYLVVAADKGTATFSDIANGVARKFGFWLDDAFASGGSVGYDHKKMGITAKGAWVSVMRHFSEMGRDIHKNPFTVAGIGDISGDVFGNGMLLSDKILLKAAFNHLHIFIDPTPDAQTSFAERKRLFELAKGSWDEYDATVISAGGGVYSRADKSIKLTSQAQKMLGVNAAQITPNDLIKAILRMEVDLLWNGGIGTYVKASTEGHEAAGDPSNNPLRVNANELKASIVAEGGNLGFTQNARIEFARNGGRINTDAIDNSAGVDCSDHEVNIKIAVSSLLSSGKIDIQSRDKLLAEMTNDVAKLVLRDNHLQNMALSVAESRAPDRIELHTRFIRDLERRGMLDRAVEYLPSDKALNDLKAEKRGLTRPELSILLAYSKIDLYNNLNKSKLVIEPIYHADLLGYFPKILQEKYAETLLSHPLKSELVATILTNEIVNRAGISYVFGIYNDTGHDVCNIVRAYTVVREVFGLQKIWQHIEALQGTRGEAMIIELFTHVTRFLKRMSIWFLNNFAQPLAMEEIIARYQTRIADYKQQMGEFVSGAAHEWRMNAKAEWLQKGIPENLAEEIVTLEGMISACDIAMLDDALPHDLNQIGKAYYDIGGRLQLSWLRIFLREFTSDHHWDKLAVASAINELYEQQRRITKIVLKNADLSEEPQTLVANWVEENHGSVERFNRLLYDIKASERHDMSIIMVVLRQLGAIKG
jgi:glutamate dehydrogenase